MRLVWGRGEIQLMTDAGTGHPARARGATRPAETTGMRPAPLYATIHGVLKDNLASGRLPAGLVIGPTAVARLFGVSRIPAAAALAELAGQGLVDSFDGRGYLVPGGEPLRRDLIEAGLVLPEGVGATPSRREQIYAEVEHAVAACLPYGRFILNESALAQSYDVSRTIAHEVLAQLELAGVIEQDSNKRWYAGPFTAADFERHFEMRWLLEPLALRQSFPMLKHADLDARLRRVKAASRPVPPLDLEQMEADLHTRTLALCPNPVLLRALKRSQRLILVTHSTFVDFQDHAEIGNMLDEHETVYRRLLAGDVEGAASTLEMHLRRSLTPCLDMLSRLPPIPEHVRPPYLVLAD
jgi:DNA-binding GntR family transcriptional regulator